MIYTPGTVFFPQESDGEHWLRLNYTYETMERLTAGLNLLIKAIKKLSVQNESLDKETGVRPIV
jgi:DNA-binding transcriptional MocR family regulator